MLDVAISFVVTPGIVSDFSHGYCKAIRLEGVVAIEGVASESIAPPFESGLPRCHTVAVESASVGLGLVFAALSR